MPTMIEIACGFCNSKKLINKAHYDQAISRGSRNFYCNYDHFKQSRTVQNKPRPGEGYNPSLMQNLKDEAKYWRDRILLAWPVKCWKDMTDEEKEEINQTCKPPRNEK